MRRFCIFYIHQSIEFAFISFSCYYRNMEITKLYNTPEPTDYISYRAEEEYEHERAYFDTLQETTPNHNQK